MEDTAKTVIVNKDKYGLGRAFSSAAKAVTILGLTAMLGFCDQIRSRIEHGPTPVSQPHTTGPVR